MPTARPPHPCRLFLAALAAAAALAGSAPQAAPLRYEWSQWRGPTRDGVWQQTGLLARFPAAAMAPVWRASLGTGYCGPTVGGSRVIVMDRIVEPSPQERIRCFQWRTGKEIWTHAYPSDYTGLMYPDGPRASVNIRDGRVYALGAVGQLTCLWAPTGKVLWSRDLRKEYQIQLPMWGISSAPLIEGDLVILQIGGKDACLLALDRVTGEERWRALSDKASYSAPIVIDQAGKRVLVCATGERVVGVDPQTGTLYWEYPWPSRPVIIAIASPVVEGDRLFLTSFYQGSLMLRLLRDRPGVEKIWQRVGQNERATDGLQSIISTPLMIGGYVYGVDSYGELRCLDARNGDRLWESQDAVPRNRWATIHFVKNGDRIWMFNERGQLIIARLTPKGYEELSRTQVLKPTLGQLPQREGVCWSHPAFAYKHIFVRNDEELLCVNLAAPAAPRATTHAKRKAGGPRRSG